MPPRHFKNPAPKTESARAAAATFYCGLCQKGYSRQNEFQAHEASYEHNHNLRRKELKSMNQQMSAASSRSKKNNERDSGLIKMNINPHAINTSSSAMKVIGTTSVDSRPRESGFKAVGAGSSNASKNVSGFRLTGFKIGVAAQSNENNGVGMEAQSSSKSLQDNQNLLKPPFGLAKHDIFLSEGDLYPEDETGSDLDFNENAYDPMRPTGCDVYCSWKQDMHRSGISKGIIGLMQRDIPS